MRKILFNRGLFLIYLIALFVIGVYPLPLSYHTSHGDLAIHIYLFLLLAHFFVTTAQKRHSFFYNFSILVSIAAIHEGAQLFLSYRHASWLDFGANIVGILTVLLIPEWRNALKILFAKDYVTIGNIFVGFSASLLALQGHLQMAMYFIPLAFVFDHMDGKVAKWTGRTNKFGAEFDNMADLISYSVAPAFIVYAFYLKVNVYFAVIMGAIPLITGCIRFARNNTYTIKYPGFWLGVPRPVSAFFLVAVLGSHLQYLPYFKIAAVPLVVIISYGNLSFFPFMAHYGRKFTFALKFFTIAGGILMLAGIVATVVTGEPWLLDVLLLEMSVYTFFTRFLLRSKEFEKLPHYIKEVDEMMNKDLGIK
ncbi:CDP-alcohol phosphatidyltransferase family protein [bacterium]|nr:CDP-alcohol phosphatidyltransferase family protein [bacterium]